MLIRRSVGTDECRRRRPDSQVGVTVAEIEFEMEEKDDVTLSSPLPALPLIRR